MMARYTINLTDTTAVKLAEIVARYNADNGSALTVTDWITLHLRELAIQSELHAAIDASKRQLELDVGAAVQAERQRLLDENL